jgi:hypothetical protein
VQKHKLGVEKSHSMEGELQKNMGNKKEKKNILHLHVQIKENIFDKISSIKSFFQQLFLYDLDYFEKNIFNKIDNKIIIKWFQNIKTRKE